MRQDCEMLQRKKLFVASKVKSSSRMKSCNSAKRSDSTSVV